MAYDKAAVRASVDLMGLAPRSLQFVEQWLDNWSGQDLPPVGSFPGAHAESLSPLIMITALEPDAAATITFMGPELVRATGLDLTGMDWIGLAPPESRGERLRRANAIGAGAILRTTREVQLDSQEPYFFETISVPLKPDADGRVPLVHFADWAPPREDATIVHKMRSNVPDLAEIIPLSGDGATPSLSERARQQDERVKIISRAATRFLLNLLADAAQTPEDLKLDPIDYIIAIAVGAANVSHIDNDAGTQPAICRAGRTRQHAPQHQPGGGVARHQSAAGDGAPAHQQPDRDRRSEGAGGRHHPVRHQQPPGGRAPRPDAPPCSAGGPHGARHPRAGREPRLISPSEYPSAWFPRPRPRA